MATGTVLETISVFLLAENRLLRDALVKILDKKNGIQVLAANAYSAQALQQIIEHVPNILLLDSAAFEFSGVQITQAARRELPDLKVILIGMEANKETFLRAVRAGIAGYVLTLRQRRSPRLYVSWWLTMPSARPTCLALFESVARQPLPLPVFHSKRKSGLSRREQQLLERVGCGLINKEIASELNLSEQTSRTTSTAFCRRWERKTACQRSRVGAA